MPRKPRIEYAGAVYHMMNRGDQGEPVFKDGLDYGNFLSVAGECCKRSGWVVHAYVLMPNHFHLLLETKQANLADGMKWLMGAYTQKFNRRHGLRGHLFQGRYKAVLIQSDSGNYFERVSTYIHLNPARAGMLKQEGADLSQYGWSSYVAYVGGERPEWLEVRRVFGNLGLKDERRGREEYRKYIYGRIADLKTKRGRKMYKAEWKALRHGWYVGGADFEEYLLGKLGGAVSNNKRDSYSGEAIIRHDEAEAERLVNVGMKILGISENDLDGMRKGAMEKRLLALLVQDRTMAKQSWTSERLRMGVASNVGTYARSARESSDPNVLRLRKALYGVILK